MKLSIPNSSGVPCEGLFKNIENQNNLQFCGLFLVGSEYFDQAETTMAIKNAKDEQVFLKRIYFEVLSDYFRSNYFLGDANFLKTNKPDKYKPSEEDPIGYMDDHTDTLLLPRMDYKDSIKFSFQLNRLVFEPVTHEELHPAIERYIIQNAENSSCTEFRFKALDTLLRLGGRFTQPTVRVAGAPRIVYDSEGSSKFFKGDIHFSKLREALTDSRSANKIVCEKLSSIVSVASIEALLAALNAILKMRYFYSKIDIDNYKSSISNEMQQLLSKAPTLVESFTDKDWSRLNRALLAAIYPQAIRKETWKAKIELARNHEGIALAAQYGVLEKLETAIALATSQQQLLSLHISFLYIYKKGAHSYCKLRQRAGIRYVYTSAWEGSIEGPVYLDDFPTNGEKLDLKQPVLRLLKKEYLLDLVKDAETKSKLLDWNDPRGKDWDRNFYCLGYSHSSKYRQSYIHGIIYGPAFETSEDNKSQTTVNRLVAKRRDVLFTVDGLIAGLEEMKCASKDSKWRLVPSTYITMLYALRHEEQDTAKFSDIFREKFGNGELFSDPEIC